MLSRSCSYAVAAACEESEAAADAVRLVCRMLTYARNEEAVDMEALLCAAVLVAMGDAATTGTVLGDC